MAREEAIESLNLCKTTRIFMPKNEVLEMAIEALEKQDVFERALERLEKHPSHTGLMMKEKSNRNYKRRGGIDMWKSPIEVYRTQLETQMEGEILKAVHKVGVLVDKDELMKALKYDRDQYNNGYHDGLNANKWIPCSERFPEDMEKVLVWFEYFRYGDYNRLYQTIGISYTWKGEWSGFVNGESGWHKLRIIAWQPLPEPYREE